VPFRHPDRSHDLDARIEYEVRERLEEAVDYVCLDALVQARRAQGLPPPAADNPEDRRAYTANVLAFLDLLRCELSPALSIEDQRKLPAPNADGDPQAHLIALQVVLARRLPDYWQRFEAVQTRFLASPELRTADADTVGSRGERRGLLARLFGGR
jgi:hypothetical protein